MPLLEQVEPVGQGDVLTERAWQEKVDASWRSHVTLVWWVELKCYAWIKPINMLNTSTAGASCKCIEALNWSAHASKASLKYEWDLKGEKKQRKRNTRHVHT